MKSLTGKAMRSKLICPVQPWNENESSQVIGLSPIHQLAFCNLPVPLI